MNTQHPMANPNQKSLDKRNIFTVSEVTTRIKSMLESSFPSIWIEGEISNYKRQLSGHAYLTLKDDTSQLSAVIWRSLGDRLAFKPDNGQKVLVSGRITVYGPRGQYQLVIDKIEPQGIGALTIAFEQLKKKLHKEGLFNEEYKKALPYLPESIGIVTSATGAAIKDILNVLNRRFQSAHVIIYPVHVQGELAKGEIAQAIQDFNTKVKVDVIIVTRGGGSLEDLWAFNEELVARAIFKSKIPIMSAVGHEVDWTIADFVADYRAPTPSAAAEIILPEKEKLLKDILLMKERLKNGLRNKLVILEEQLTNLRESYIMKRPMQLIEEYGQRIDDIVKNIYSTLLRIHESKQSLFKEKIAKMEALSPLKILSRGYSITMFDSNKRNIISASDIKHGDIVETRLSKGKFKSKITEIDHG